MSEGKEFFENEPKPEPEVKKVVTTRHVFESLPETDIQFESSLGTFNRLRGEVLRFREQMLAHKVTFQLTTNTLGLEAATASARALETPGLGSDAAARAMLSQVQTASSGPGVTYEVYLNKSEQNPLTALDRRVDNLSRAVGTAEGPVLGKMQDLQSRLQLTEEYKLDAVVRRTQALTSEITTIELPEQKQEVDAGKALQIEALRKLFANRTATAQGVPASLSRVKTRQESDDYAAQLLLRLKRLQQSHDAAQRSLLADQEMLSKVASQFQTNSQITAGNLRLLQQRLATL